MSTHYRFLAQAKERFAFLHDRGYPIESESEGSYASFKDGFQISYAAGELRVRVEYYDTEFDVAFTKGKISAGYLFLDHNQHANASGLAGSMFPSEKLPPVIDRVAKDIETNYEAVLRGNDAVWQKIKKLISAPQEKKSDLP